MSNIYYSYMFLIDFIS